MFITAIHYYDWVDSHHYTKSNLELALLLHTDRLLWINEGHCEAQKSVQTARVYFSLVSSQTINSELSHE